MIMVLDLRVPFILDHLKQAEKDFYSYVIDLLAHEYGWTIEYIESLSLPTIVKLIKAIRKRHDTQDQLFQINVAKGMTGKISSNSKPEPMKHSENEQKNLEVLARMLKTKVYKVKNGKT